MLHKISCLILVLATLSISNTAFAENESGLAYEAPIKGSKPRQTYLDSIEAFLKKEYKLPKKPYPLIRPNRVHENRCKDGSAIVWIPFYEGASAKHIPGYNSDDGGIPFVGGSGGNYVLYVYVASDKKTALDFLVYDSIEYPKSVKTYDNCPKLSIVVHGSEFGRVGNQYGKADVSIKNGKIEKILIGK